MSSQSRLTQEDQSVDTNLTKILESLYVVNKHAKKYAEQGTENYRKGKKTTAKANSNKKKALYQLKENVLSEIREEAEKVDIHEIDGNQFYCLYFQDFSFHTPIRSLEIVEDRIDEREELEDFEKEAEKEKVSKSLKDSLLYLEAVFGFNANEYLPEKKLWYGHNRYFIGWDYLGEESN